MLPFRSFVQTPLSGGRLLLAGDAAHTVPPTGAKGLNLALADARVLAEVVERALATRDLGVLSDYEDRALARVWKAQQFSYWMTTMLHRADGTTDFDEQRQRSELAGLVASRGRVHLSRGGIHRMAELVTGSDPQAVLETQGVISGEMSAIAGRYAGGELQPRLDYPPYRSSMLRHPTKALQQVDPEGVELWSPCFGERDVDPLEADLTIQRDGEPIGERMVVTGRVLDGDGPTGAPPAGRGLAGQRRRPLHPPARPAPGAARPALHRDGPVPDRRRRPLPVHDDQAGALPVAQPPQRLAARPHPLLACSAPSSRSGW